MPGFVTFFKLLGVNIAYFNRQQIVRNVMYIMVLAFCKRQQLPNAMYIMVLHLFVTFPLPKKLPNAMDIRVLVVLRIETYGFDTARAARQEQQPPRRRVAP